MRIYFQMVCFRKVQYPLVRFREIYNREDTKFALGLFDAHDNVFSDCLVSYQHEMLVDHSDVQCICNQWAADCLFFPTNENFSFIWGIHAKEHTHESRFAGSILSKYGKDFAFPDGQGNVVICNNAGESFGDIPKFYEIFHFGTPYKTDTRACIRGHGLDYMNT